MKTSASTGTDERAPCPFCGSDDISDGEVLTGDADKSTTQSECQKCGALGPRGELAPGQIDYGCFVAIGAWNRRAAPGAAQVPVLWVSPEQADAHTDLDDPTAGRYLPCRRTPAGKFTLPLYAQPVGAAKMPADEAPATPPPITDAERGMTKREVDVLDFCVSQMADLDDKDWRDHGFRQSTFESMQSKLSALTRSAPSAGAAQVPDSWNEAIEAAAKRIEGGSFLHDKSPAKLFANELAPVIRSMKRPEPTAGAAQVPSLSDTTLDAIVVAVRSVMGGMSGDSNLAAWAALSQPSQQKGA